MTSYRIINALFRFYLIYMKFERGIGFFALIFSILVIGAFIALSIYLIRLDNIIREKFEGQRCTFGQGVCSTLKFIIMRQLLKQISPKN